MSKQYINLEDKPGVKATNPYRDAIFIILSRDDHLAGFLLTKIVYWHQYARAQIPGVEGYWIAHKREFWEREARLSPGQYNRAIARLASWGLIEKCQWWFAGQNILHVRPTALTKSFLAIATTWDAAAEFLPEYTIECEGSPAGPTEIADLSNLGKALEGPAGIADPGNPSSPIFENSNENVEINNPSLAKPEISNNIKNIQTSFGKNKEPTDACAASPPCVKEPGSEKKKVTPGEKKKKNNKKFEDEKDYNKFEFFPKTKPIPLPPQHQSNNKLPTIKELANGWAAAVLASEGQLIDQNATVSLTPAGIGALGVLKKSLEGICIVNNPYEMERFALDIIAYVVLHWQQCAQGKVVVPPIPGYPDPSFLHEIDAINEWVSAKCVCYSWVPVQSSATD